MSRVGGAAQTKVIKKLGGGVRLALAQYRELASFAQFASDLDEATKAQLEHGKRVTELLKQKQYSPLSVAQQAVTLFAADKGYLKDVAIEKLASFENALHSYLSAEAGELETRLNDTGDWDDDIQNQFHELLKELKKPKHIKKWPIPKRLENKYRV